MQGPCAVCVLVDGDRSHKEVEWCPRCKAWLCESCKRQWGRRIVGAFVAGVLRRPKQ